MLVSYDGDAWWHERCVLGFAGGDGLCVVTPHWDVYVEVVGDYSALHQFGPRGGMPSEVYGRRVVRFDRDELARRLPGLLRTAHVAEPGLADSPFECSGGGRGSLR